MTEFYKLAFDCAVYFTLSGFYLRLFSGKAPSAAGFVLLLLVTALDALLRRKGRERHNRILPLLPLITLVFRPGLWPMLQLLPAWLYVSWSILSGNIDLQYLEFRRHFGFGLKLLILIAPGLNSSGWKEALQGVLPYLTLMLACGVCLLRMLREQTPSGLRQGLYVAALVALGIGLTAGHVPQLLVQCLGLAYRWVLLPLLLVVMLAVGAVVYGVYSGFLWLLSLLRGTPGPRPEMNLQTGAQMLGLEEELAPYTSDDRWLRILLLVLGAIVLVLVLFLIFRRLMGHSTGRADTPAYSEHSEDLARRRAKRAASFPGIRPRDPRLAIRHDYARFLAESSRRGLQRSGDMTADELRRRSAPLFPDADCDELTALYLPARYRLRTPVPSVDAQRSAAAWQRLRRSKTPNDMKKR